jgi:hypothetical protein
MSEPMLSNYYKTHFSPEQIKAAEQAIEEYKQGKYNWIILLAQMQSGKTDVFLLISCELFRMDMVKFIIIFSGNAESELCEQISDTVRDADSDYWEKYENYVQDRHIAKDIRQNLNSKDEPRLRIVWGTQKTSYSGPSESTLFIWEEAHFAQNKDQGPAKFLKKLVISADGTQHFLEDKKNFVLTVSATPFSEISDCIHFEQNKKIVKMEPGENYISVGYLLSENRVRPWHTIEEGLVNACSLPRTTKKWAIIRVIDRNVELVESIMKSNGWKCEKYDSSIPLSDRKNKIIKCKDSGYIAWNDMASGKAPDSDTVIIIKGMCRMGKNIKKSHLLFVFETSKSPSSDTILQGLLGRSCGYLSLKDSSNNVIVYLSEKVVNNGEIERYVELWNNPDICIIPRKANNLTEKQIKETKPIIPIVIKRDTNISRTNNDKDIKADVFDALFNHRERILNKNTNTHFEEVISKYGELYVKNGGIHAFYLDSKKKTRGADKAEALRSAFKSGTSRDFGSGCGHASDGLQVNIWVNKNIEGHDTGIFYITSVVAIGEDERLNFLIPKTTKREVFAHYLEDGTSIECNGGMPKLLSPSTTEDWKAMCHQLSDFVEVSRDTAYYKGIISLGTDDNGEPKGIIVTPRVLKELEKGGQIYNLIKIMGAELKVEKSRGRVPKSIQGEGFIKLASIKWEFK